MFSRSARAVDCRSTPGVFQNVRSSVANTAFTSDFGASLSLPPSRPSAAKMPIWLPALSYTSVRCESVLRWSAIFELNFELANSVLVPGTSAARHKPTPAPPSRTMRAKRERRRNTTGPGCHTARACKGTRPVRLSASDHAAGQRRERGRPGDRYEPIGGVDQHAGLVVAELEIGGRNVGLELGDAARFGDRDDVRLADQPCQRHL